MASHAADELGELGYQTESEEAPDAWLIHDRNSMGLYGPTLARFGAAMHLALTFALEMNLLEQLRQIAQGTGVWGKRLSPGERAKMLTLMCSGQVTHGAVHAVGGVGKLGGELKFAGAVRAAASEAGVLQAAGHAYQIPKTLSGKAKLYTFVAKERVQFALTRGKILYGEARDTGLNGYEFGSHDPIPNEITLRPGHDITSLAEELFHFRQAKQLGIIRKSRFPYETPYNYATDPFELEAHEFLTEVLGLKIR